MSLQNNRDRSWKGFSVYYFRQRKIEFPKGKLGKESRQVSITLHPECLIFFHVHHFVHIETISGNTLRRSCWQQVSWLTKSDVGTSQEEKWCECLPSLNLRFPVFFTRWLTCCFGLQCYMNVVAMFWLSLFCVSIKTLCFLQLCCVTIFRSSRTPNKLDLRLCGSQGWF